MAYMKVKKKTKDELRLQRRPSLRSWFVIAGIFISGVSFISYQRDFVVNDWRFSFYVVACLLVSLQFLDEWELCVFDKRENVVKLMRKSIFARILRRRPHTVVLQLNAISEVYIRSDVLKYPRTNLHTVCLTSEEGQVFRLTGCGTSDDKKEHQKICDVIKSFLSEKKEE